ncbi:glycine--tRNA ligase [Balamuthia mandrillaris]
MEAPAGQEVTYVDYPKKLPQKRERIEALLKSRFFIAPAFSIYGGVSGLYDYGPPGCAVKANLLSYWRQHFVLEENMLEVDCTSLTPEKVLEVSGHKKKFADFMVREIKEKEDGEPPQCFRADHLLEEHLEKLLKTEKLDPATKHEYENDLARADEFSQEELAATLKKYNVKSPNGLPISDPFPFNLMFQTSIGPTGTLVGYLRPETAQGIFVNFKRLLEFNGGKLPFAAAQIGTAFRNEIAPRSGVLRVREFQMAEIEHFVREDKKAHPKFTEVENVVMSFYSREDQVGSHKHLVCTMGYAVKNGIVGNQTLGYFMARTHLFLIRCGAKPEYVRFRQHLKDEMAHYASDCWDAELLTTYGWIECVGHADRSAYDLTKHSKHSNEKLTAYEAFDTPEFRKVLKLTINKGLIGKTFRGDAKHVNSHLESLDEQQKKVLEAELKSGEATICVDDKQFKITPDMVNISEVEQKVSGETFTPHVIEPSFGIGRIIYCILEQCYYVREDDEQKGVMGLPPIVAPVKCSVLPLIQNPKLEAFVPRITSALTAAGLSSKVDATGQTIGRRYARTDEIGVPFGVTIDFQTVEDETVTLRERETLKQLRVPIAELASVVQSIVEGRTTWEEVLASGKYPLQETNNKD